MLRLAEQYEDLHKQEHALRFGMWGFLASEVLLFAALFGLYASYRAAYGIDFADAVAHNNVYIGTANTLVLITSSLTAALAIWSVRSTRYRLITPLLFVTVAFGGVFLLVKAFEYRAHFREGFFPGHAYRSVELPSYGAHTFFNLYYAMTGLHALHVTAGMLVLAILALRARRSFYTAEHHVGLEMGVLYWHLVDVIWIFLWPLLYLSRA